MNNNQSHEFSLYFEPLSAWYDQNKQRQQIIVDDEHLYHRITRVLRLKINEPLIFFDRNMHINCQLREIDKKTIVLSVIKKNSNRKLEPSITFLLPILKKEHFDEALYSMTELGASVIQLVITEKTQRSWDHKKDMERAERIVIAAAEQSKNFSLPRLNPPISIENIRDIVQTNCSKIFFDMHGLSLTEFFAQAKQFDLPFFLMIGPEGDLTESEKKLIEENGFTFVRLTQTVIRSHQAAALGLGLIRSFI